MSATPFFILFAIASLIVLAGMIGAIILLRWVLGEKKRPSDLPRLTPVDCNALSSAPPAKDRIRLEIYNMPVRVSAVVVASAGRDTKLPADIPKLLEQLSPGLGTVCEKDRPSIVRWPPQLSTQGFAHAFFMNASLPGDQGKGTPWCSVAGRLEQQHASALVGLVLRSSAPNSLGQIVVERTTQWLDVLRVRHDLDSDDL
ncbi:hypothetical protein ACFL2H_06280 [Planctomycetota bacterium]